LNHKSFQIAETTDFSLPLRKWWHRGSFWDVSSLNAAYTFFGAKYGKEGKIVKTHVKDEAGVVYEFSNGVFVRVAFG
jgi:hypothetical protein